MLFLLFFEAAVSSIAWRLLSRAMYKRNSLKHDAAEPYPDRALCRGELSLSLVGKRFRFSNVMGFQDIFGIAPLVWVS